MVEEAAYRSPAELREFARRWTSLHRGETSDTTRLGGFCLAVRRDVFETMGGFDEDPSGSGHDDDLCRRLLEDGYRLVICHDAFVHHENRATATATAPATAGRPGGSGERDR